MGTHELLSQEADFRRQNTDGLRQASDQTEQFSQDAGKTNRRNQLMRLTAPVAGTVQQLAIHTVGGVVTPAQPLLAIVPEGESLEVEAMVENKDIGFVREGQEAVIKVESFPYTRYGYLTGKVVSVSHDAIQDEKRGLLYQAKVRLNAHRLNVAAILLNRMFHAHQAPDSSTDTCRDWDSNHGTCLAEAGACQRRYWRSPMPVDLPGMHREVPAALAELAHSD